MSIKYIIKSTGEKEIFDRHKFERSLKKSGARQILVDEMVDDIMRQPQLDTTQQIYEYALDRLHTQDTGLAARYNLKNALFQLGPSGYSFEQFLARVFQAHGYQTHNDVTMSGRCVTHEVDILMQKDNVHTLVECKFHAHRGLKSNVKVPLYVKARFDDLEFVWKNEPSHANELFDVMTVSNTTFTSEALKYAQCVGLKAIDWSYPEKGNLAQLIDESGMYPITSLTTLSKSQKRKLIERNVVLCNEIETHASALNGIGLNNEQKDEVIKQAKQVCPL